MLLQALAMRYMECCKTSAHGCQYCLLYAGLSQGAAVHVCHFCGHSLLQAYVFLCHPVLMNPRHPLNKSMEALTPAVQGVHFLIACCIKLPASSAAEFLQRCDPCASTNMLTESCRMLQQSSMSKPARAEAESVPRRQGQGLLHILMHRPSTTCPCRWLLRSMHPNSSRSAAVL